LDGLGLVGGGGWRGRLLVAGWSLHHPAQHRCCLRPRLPITNPTHIAVALKYDVHQAGAPVVVAMGERKLAERIKAIAGKAGVPIIENKPLARALRAACTVGAPIPPAFFIAVAEILAYVYRIRRRMPAAVATAAAEMRPA
jgi:flagellar biosynthesis protein FlhB